MPTKPGLERLQLGGLPTLTLTPSGHLGLLFSILLLVTSENGDLDNHIRPGVHLSSHPARVTALTIPSTRDSDGTWVSKQS